MHKTGTHVSHMVLGAIAASAILLQGCLAAAIPFVYKSIQTSTGDSEVQIGFGKESYSTAEKDSLAGLHSLAIMPLSANDTSLEVALAESLSTVGTLKVITPATVLRSQTEANNTTNFNALTRDEKAVVLRKICLDLGADGLVYAGLTGSEFNTNTWSFSRANQVYQIEMNIYSNLENRIVISDSITAKITVGGNSNMTDMNEIGRIIGAAMGERIRTALQ